MSGTSLDGLDCCMVEYSGSPTRLQCNILAAETLDYSPAIIRLLKNMETCDGDALWEGHIEYGKFLGISARDFVQASGFRADLLSSHGHTIFHRPEKGYTFQAGHGQAIALWAGMPTVCDFRTADVLKGGQGAPLVPLADRILFGQYAACLNLGGFANISAHNADNAIAFDICPVNYVLNALSQRMGKPYDKDGEIARGGTIDTHLLEQLNALPFYQQQPPKSLGREWVTANITPLLSTIDTAVALRTFTHHAALQIGAALKDKESVLVTGGGTYNTTLMQEIKILAPHCQIVIPDSRIIEFKEALIFAWMGWCTVEGVHNVDGTITGSGRMHCAGSVFIP